MAVVFAANAKHVDVETAKNVARTFWNKNAHGAKGNAGKLIDVTSQTNFSNFYIFNTAEGFIIVSNDDVVMPILGYSTEGQFNGENIPVNTLGWLKGYEAEIQYAIEKGLVATEKISAEWEQLANGNGIAAKRSRAVDKLVQTKWDQSPYYNKYCPYDSTLDQRSVTGCTATATAQVMKYWNWPAKGIYRHSYMSNYGVLSADYGSTTYDWENMPVRLNESSREVEVDAIATLIYHCGIAVEMDYSPEGSGASVAGSGASAETALKSYFQYKRGIVSYNKDYYEDEEWFEILNTDIDAGRPIIYTGYSDDGGHAFVCDGYDDNGKYHFNWGWSGTYDGYFTVENLHPGTYTFNNWQAALTGIEPNYEFSVFPNKLIFAGRGETKDFGIHSNREIGDNWTATTSESWLTITPETGEGNGANATILATAEMNSTDSSRTAIITIVHGEDTIVVNATQPSGLPNAPGCYGNEIADNNSENQGGNGYPRGGATAVICSEGFGYYENGQAVTKVKFTTAEREEGGYPPHRDGTFTIKIYEGGNSELVKGYSAANEYVIGTEVYSQQYTQTTYGQQEVTLSSPYIIDSATNFWIAVAPDRTSKIGETIVVLDTIFGNSADRPDDSEAADKIYLGMMGWGNNYYIGSNGIVKDSVINGENDSHAYILQSIHYTLSFCIEDFDGFSVTPTTMIAKPRGENRDFRIATGSNGAENWQASTQAEWITLSENQGEAGSISTVTATILPNYTMTDRNAEILISFGNEHKTIAVSQGPLPFYTITSTANKNGTISPKGDTVVAEGCDFSYVITPDENGILKYLLIDGKNATLPPEAAHAPYTYTFTNVKRNHTIDAVFFPYNSVDQIDSDLISVFPSPNNGSFRINFGEINGEITYQLINSNGTIADSRKLEVISNEEITFNYELPAGIYLARIISNNKAITKQIVIE